METLVKKSDFVLAPYMGSNDLIATWQVLNTLVPYGALWVLAAWVAPISYGWVLAIVPFLVLFSLRAFSLMHDCGHNSLFRSKRMNRVVGYLFGLVNAMPQYWWARDHAYHHKTNGDWERYRGIGDFLSVTEFLALPPKEQRLYGALRHPLMIFPGGFFYLAFKPRIILVAGIVDFLRDGYRLWRQETSGALPVLFSAQFWAKVLQVHQPKHWKTGAEFWDVFLNNVGVLSLWWGLSSLWGVWFFWGTYSLVLTISAACFISIFFVQHNFEDSYASHTADWSYLRGAIEGSSYLEMPKLLRWFTADISFHNIHHLSEKIPNYHLQACHRANRHLLTQTRTLRLGDLPYCARFILWDDTACVPTSIDRALQRSPQQSASMV